MCRSVPVRPMANLQVDNSIKQQAETVTSVPFVNVFFVNLFFFLSMTFIIFLASCRFRFIVAFISKNQ